MSQILSKSVMDIEYDVEKEYSITPFQGSTTQEDGYFDMDGCSNKYTLNPIYNDSYLLKSHQSKVFLAFVTYILKQYKMPIAEIKKKLNDRDYLAKIYDYLSLLYHNKCLTTA